jgi:hypothetical protein
MHKIKSYGLPLTLLFSCALLGGCAPPSLVHDTYGDAVRHMVDAQIYDQDAAANAGSKPVSLDGSKAEEVLKTHRQDVSEPEEIQEPIIIQTGRQ